eukprot:8120864-Pyramimonas_sp.AAC.1
MALISFFSEGGRVSSGARSVESAPTALPPFGRKAKSESFRSRVKSRPEQRMKDTSSKRVNEASCASQAEYGKQS